MLAISVNEFMESVNKDGHMAVILQASDAIVIAEAEPNEANDLLSIVERIKESKYLHASADDVPIYDIFDTIKELSRSRCIINGEE